MKYGSVGPISLLRSSGAVLVDAQRSACEMVMSRKSSQASDSSSLSFFLAAFSSPELVAIFWIASSVRMKRGPLPSFSSSMPR